jgi:hypothetical protein
MGEAIELSKTAREFGIKIVVNSPLGRALITNYYISQLSPSDLGELLQYSQAGGLPEGVGTRRGHNSYPWYH